MRIASVVIVFLILVLSGAVFAIEDSVQGSWEDYYSQARSKAYSGETEEAFKDIEKAISLNPNYAPLYVCRGGIYLKKGELEKSLNDSNKAISLDSKLANAYKNRAVAYIEQKNYDLAKKDILAFSSLSDESNYLRALYKHSRGEYLEAVKEANIVLANNPKEQRSALIMLSSYIELKNYIKVLESAKEMEKKNPSIKENPSFLYYKTISYGALGMPEKALKCVNKLVALDSQNPHYYELRAVLSFGILNKKASHKDFETARGIYQKEGGQEGYVRLAELENELIKQAKKQAVSNSALYASNILSIVSGILAIIAISI